MGFKPGTKATYLCKKCNILTFSLVQDDHELGICYRCTKENETKPKKAVLTHNKVAEKATRYLFNLHGCIVGAWEFACGWQTAERCDGLCFNNGLSFMVEAKVSRSDFHADKKKMVRQPGFQERLMCVGNYRYYACPEGMIKPEELPEKWGLIYVTSRGCRLIKGFGAGHYTNGGYKSVGEVGEAGRKYHFETNPTLDNKILLFMAKRYRQQKFMDNMI